MTAVELQTELLREISPIAEDEGLMRKVINYVRDLVRIKDEEVETKEDVVGNMREAFAEFNQYKEGQLEFQSADDLLNELRTL